MSNRALQVGGVAALAGVGYYMYQAGGDPKAAQKRVEADAHKIGSSDQVKQTQKQFETASADVGAKVDQYSNQAKAEMDKVDSKLGQFRKDASKELDQAAQKTQINVEKASDTFDRKVGESTKEAKSGLSSWFGGK